MVSLAPIVVQIRFQVEVRQVHAMIRMTEQIAPCAALEDIPFRIMASSDDSFPEVFAFELRDRQQSG